MLPSLPETLPLYAQDGIAFLHHEAPYITGYTGDGRYVAVLEKHPSVVTRTELDHLAHLAQAGGVARVVWSDQGEMRVLNGAQIMNWNWSRTEPHQLYLLLDRRAIGGKEIDDWLMVHRG